MRNGPVAYLVMAYHKPEQLGRLLSRLRRESPAAPLALHFDARSPMAENLPLEALGVEPVTPRFKVSWGDFSLVEAVLAGFRTLLAHPGWRYACVLSGQDYPLRPLQVIEQSLLVSGIDVFMDASPEHEYLHRYTFRYWRCPKFRYGHKLPASIREAIPRAWRWINERQEFLRIEWQPRGNPPLLGLRRLRTIFRADYQCWFGSDWFTVSRRAVEILFETVERDPRLVSHYRHTLIPSESFFATIWGNAPDIVVEAGDNRRFILWPGDNAAHPVTLTMQHFEAMVRSGKDFARKFDMEVDAEVLDALDRCCGM